MSETRICKGHVTQGCLRRAGAFCMHACCMSFTNATFHGFLEHRKCAEIFNHPESTVHILKHWNDTITVAAGGKAKRSELVRQSAANHRSNFRNRRLFLSRLSSAALALCRYSYLPSHYISFSHYSVGDGVKLRLSFTYRVNVSSRRTRSRVSAAAAASSNKVGRKERSVVHEYLI